MLKYASDGKSSQPLGDWYETSDGSVEGFRARPVVGGHLALVCFFILTEPDVVLTVLPSFLVDLVIVLLSECQAIKKLCSYICIHPFCHHHGGLFEHGFTGMRSGCE